MKWTPEEILDDFVVVARLAHVAIEKRAIRIEILRMPHRPPSRLPDGKTAVYVFSEQERVLKVGKVGTKSQARYTSQHYTGSAASTLSGSLLSDGSMVRRWGLGKHNVSAWIKESTDRVNFLVDAQDGPLVLALLETFVQCRLKPVYEGRGK